MTLRDPHHPDVELCWACSHTSGASRATVPSEAFLSRECAAVPADMLASSNGLFHLPVRFDSCLELPGTGGAQTQVQKAVPLHGIKSTLCKWSVLCSRSADTERRRAQLTPAELNSAPSICPQLPVMALPHGPTGSVFRLGLAYKTWKTAISVRPCSGQVPQ